MSTMKDQIKISLSPQLKTIIALKASDIGIPITQYVKYLIINDIKYDPILKASKKTEDRAKLAMEEINNLNPVQNIKNFLEEL